MKTVEEIKQKIVAINNLILKSEMNAEHSDEALRIELYNDIESYENEIDLLKWVLSES